MMTSRYYDCNAVRMTKSIAITCENLKAGYYYPNINLSTDTFILTYTNQLLSFMHNCLVHAFNNVEWVKNDLALDAF